MNRYIVRIPYDYAQYGTLTCEVYAESEEEAEDLASDYRNRHEEDYNNSDDSGDSEYDYDNMEIELDEEDVVAPGHPYNPYTHNPQNKESSHLVIAAEFISDLVLV